LGVLEVSTRYIREAKPPPYAY